MSKASPFAKNTKAKPKQLTADPFELVRLHDEGARKPLIIEALADVDAAQWLGRVRDRLEALLMHHGALLFRGFRVTDQPSFQRFAGSLYDDLYGGYGDLPKAKDKVYGATPYPPEDPILFHNEASHTHRWPMRQFFYCHQPAPEGGATVLADCRTLYEQSPADLLRRLTEEGLRYVRNFHQGVDVSWQDFFKTDDRDEVVAFCREKNIECQWLADDHLRTTQWAPAVARHPVTDEPLLFNQIQLHHVVFVKPEVRETMTRMFATEDLPRNVTFGDGSPISDETALALEADCWRHGTPLQWRQGDVALLDNMLVSHAREAYQPPRKIFVILARIMHQHEILTA